MLIINNGIKTRNPTAASKKKKKKMLIIFSGVIYVQFDTKNALNTI